MSTAILGQLRRDPSPPSDSGDDRRWGQARRRSHDLANQAAARRAGGAPIDAAWLATATATVAAVAPYWETLSGSAPTERCWRALVDEPELQGWLICWPAGMALDLHDHGGAPGAFTVLRGTLEEHSAQCSGAPLRRRRLAVGEGSAFGPRFIHSVSNPDRQLVTSVHFYGPALGVPVDYVVAADRTAQPLMAAA